MENSIVPSLSLDITNLTHAEEKYGGFVDVRFPVLTLSEFQKRRNLPLNEQCSAVFYARTAHLNDIDFSETKVKNGKTKTDANGCPLLKDMCNNFSTAIRCLKITIGFI